MYNFIKDLSETSNYQNFSSTGFIPRTFKSKSGLSRFSQLPPIAEEEGNLSENEFQLTNASARSQFLDDGNSEKGFPCNRTNFSLENKAVVEEWVKSMKYLRRLPPLMNVNCLMNVNLKQQHPIWNTNFGKRLINGRTVPETLSSPTVKKVKKEDEKFRENQNSKSNSNRSFLSERNNQFGGGDKVALGVQVKKKTAKPAQGKKNSRKIKGQKVSEHEKPFHTDPEIRISKSETNCTETLTEIRSENMKKQPSSESLNTFLAAPRTIKNQNFLSECVRSIVGSVPNQFKCEHCDGIFANVEELWGHKKRHENEKEICLFCNKVFSKPNEFMQHFASHAASDKFICKKCKKHFASEKKYKTHYREVHLSGSESIEAEKKSNLDCAKKPSLKYEWKKSYIDLDSEESYRSHKRHHTKMDSSGANLIYKDI